MSLSAHLVVAGSATGDTVFIVVLCVSLYVVLASLVFFGDWVFRKLILHRRRASRKQRVTSFRLERYDRTMTMKLGIVISSGRITEVNFTSSSEVVKGMVTRSTVSQSSLMYRSPVERERSDIVQTISSIRVDWVPSSFRRRTCVVPSYAAPRQLWLTSTITEFDYKILTVEISTWDSQKSSGADGGELPRSLGPSTSLVVSSPTRRSFAGLGLSAFV